MKRAGLMLFVAFFVAVLSSTAQAAGRSPSDFFAVPQPLFAQAFVAAPVQQAYLPGPHAGDEFGFALAMEGDTLVVGAHGEDGVGSNSGAAYVFTRTAGSWTQQARLTASNAGSGDQFGICISLSGDTIIIGAPGEDGNSTGVNGADNNLATDSGAAYVFTRNGDTWSQQAYIKASNPGTGDFFGRGVAISGDTVVVGAYLEDGNSTGVNGADNNLATDSGAAYVFVRSGATWSQQSYLKASNTGAGDYFAHTVAIASDTVVIGAFLEDGSSSGINGADNNLASNAGAAYVFVRNESAWSQQAYVKPSNALAGSSFGWSLGISDDTVVVGAHGEDGASGAAYVFTRSDTTWSQEGRLRASNAAAGDYFAISVAISGDTVIVGAREEDSSAQGAYIPTDPDYAAVQSDNSAANSGAAYAFTRSGTTWTQDAYIKASNTGVNDWFGDYAAVAGDTVVVGARLEDGVDNLRTDAGAAYVLVLPSTCPTALAYTGPSVDADGDSSTTLSATLSCVDDPGLVGGQTVAFWVDVDQDGDFEGGEESVGSGTTSTGGEVAVTWNHPGLAPGDYDIKVLFAGTSALLASSDEATVTLQNVVPTVDAGPDIVIQEGSTFSAKGGFADPGADVWSATVVYGDGTAPQVLALEDDKTFTLSHRYDDDGLYTITVSVNDGYGEGSDTLLVTVENAAPTIMVDKGTWRLDARTFFVSRVNQVLSIRAYARDVGSDDLLVRFLDGTTRIFYNNATFPDPYPSSTGVAPFEVSAAGATYRHQLPGVFTDTVTATDDDGGVGADSATVVVRGAEAQPLEVAAWSSRFAAPDSAEAPRLSGYLAVVRFFSMYLGADTFVHETVPLESIDDAATILAAGGQGSAPERIRAQLLAAWLNFASGAVEWGSLVDTDGDGRGDLAYCLVLDRVERILLATRPSAAELERAAALVEACFAASQETRDRFTDVLSGHPYYHAIENMASRGIVVGFADGSFRPDAPVTRQQFAKMIVKTLELPVTGLDPSPFTDVSRQGDQDDPHYPFDYVAVCAKAGITVGVTPTVFAPHASITREQLLTMVARAAEVPDPPSGFDPGFARTGFSTEEHYLNARRAAAAGLLEGFAGVGPGLDFRTAATRAECAGLLWGLLELSGG